MAARVASEEGASPIAILPRARKATGGERLRRWLRYQWRKLTRPAEISLAGVRLCVDRGVLSPGIVGTLYKGTHEAEELEVVLAHLVPGDRVLELGAGIGLVTIACCQRIGAANVHAFEPNPALAPLIARNFAANGVAPHFTSALVASHAGTGVLHVPEHFTGARAGGDAGARALPAGTRAVPVPAVALAALLAESRPTVLVCDIEGGEVELLCGSDLAGVERIAMEVHPEIVGDAATSALIHHLLGLGFTLALSAQRGHTLLFARPPAPQDMAPPQVLA